MAQNVDRRDVSPWEKIHMVREVKSLIGSGESLSSNLRMSRFSPVGGRVKKPAVDWMCKGLQKPAEPFVPSDKGVTFKMRLKSRMMVNHSGGVMENATLALHPHFGTPFIPGSALKGIAGHVAWCEWKSADEENRELYASMITEIFGFPVGNKEFDADLKSKVETRSGAIAFLPAHCIGMARLEADLVNSHTGRSPIPVFFPAVAAGTVFQFSLMLLQRKVGTRPETLMDFAESWLRQGLREHGAGAKTNAGYGWFEEV